MEIPSVGTTNLFVELVVIGVGALAWCVLLMLGLFGWDWIPVSALNSAALLIPALSIVYLLGILVDRLADASFEALFIVGMRSRYFPNADEYFAARHTLLGRDPLLAVLVEYGRSRMRICRGWALNALLILGALHFFLVQQAERLIAPDRVRWIATVGLALLALMCWLAWRRLVISEYKKLADAARR